LWLDELEKAVGGFRGSAASDGGTTLGMVGHLLTWLNDHGSPIFTVATCNDFSALPPELTRAGRFDERFCVDLPTVSEREAIAAVHLARFGCPVDLARTIAQRTADHTGAEIESLIKTAARLSNRAITLSAIESASKTVKPLAAVNPESVREFRRWAAATLRTANDREQPSPAAAKRAALAERN
jgi:SpoVK/Ycf46/Vps4 family AAA+-type ATPase